ncbi:flavin reductase family protein [Corynebacterium sp. TAE3-ERU12]|uniref:flavin reductase family protein n=1 Tax=Corynebacterium sp. TAE3-ERU12 TaxID=2849491 RepID=UPI001C461358|nr:flavin reductase family protein [Corynebacterium sp. TAE3-ERU12]MBV7295177.1 flavin reductase family protein [Corynebacterium sp. TAE3-ERU12]
MTQRPQASAAPSYQTMPPAGEGLRVFFRGAASGVWIITTRNADGEPVGFTASSLASVSLDPAVFTFSLQSGSSSWPAVEHTREIVAHRLSTRHSELATQFATSGIDRFDGVQWNPGDDGLPVLRGTGAWLRASVISIVPVGESRLLLCQVKRTYIPGTDDAPLVHHNRTYWQPTHLDPPAP